MLVPSAAFPHLAIPGDASKAARQAKMRLRLFDGKKLSRMTMQDRTLDIRVFRDLLQKRPEHNPKLCGGEEVLLAHLR